VIFQDANVKVTAVENNHFRFPLGSPAHGKYKSYAYRFNAADRSVVFTGDTGPSNAITELATSADLLISEVSFSEPRVRFGSGPTKLTVSTTGPVILQLPTCERTLISAAWGHKLPWQKMIDDVHNPAVNW
jgi:hypothetical protein